MTASRQRGHAQLSTRVTLLCAWLQYWLLPNEKTPRARSPVSRRSRPISTEQSMGLATCQGLRGSAPANTKLPTLWREVREL